MPLLCRLKKSFFCTEPIRAYPHKLEEEEEDEEKSVGEGGLPHRKSLRETKRRRDKKWWVTKGNAVTLVRFCHSFCSWSQSLHHFTGFSSNVTHSHDHWLCRMAGMLPIQRCSTLRNSRGKQCTIAPCRTRASAQLLTHSFKGYPLERTKVVALLIAAV